MPAHSNSLGSPEAVDQVIVRVREAGQIALQHFNNAVASVKPDETFVTQADVEIEFFLSERIRALFPRHSIVGEENVQIDDAQSSANVWTIDPIDGTTAFVQGLPGWGISVGLLHQGQPHFGIFYMPLLDDLTYTTFAGNVYCNQQRRSRSVCQSWGSKGFVAVTASAHRDFQINVQRTRTIGSVGASLVYTARGAAVATFIPKANVWDLVSTAAILGRAGGELRYLSGKPVDYLELLDGRHTPEPIIAAHPDLQAEIREVIKPQQVKRKEVRW